MKSLVEEEIKSFSEGLGELKKIEFHLNFTFNP